MYIISISHKVATIEIREQFSLSKDEQKLFIKNVLENEHISECVYLGTCNRTEVYFNGDEFALSELEQYIIDFSKVSNDDMKKYFRIYQNDKAIKHLFKVASGLDSMLIGEDEILGQLKDAFNFSLELGATKYHLNTLFRGAITCAKNIKTNTKMSKIPLSIGTLVTNMILELEKKELNVLIIGLTGKMGNTIFKNLYNRKNISIVGTTRSHNTLFEYKNKFNDLKMIKYSERYDYVNDADVIISVTKSPHYAITYGQLLDNISIEKTRLFIDLSVPKDIDSDIENIENIKLVNVDYFKNIASINNNSRVKEVELCNDIISEHIDDVLKELHFHNFLNDMNAVKELFNENSFESMIYKIRDNSNSEELNTILKAFRKLIEVR